MLDNGVVTSYALFGAVAQMRYTEAVTTLDVDILVVLPEPDRLDALSGIYDYCASREYGVEGEAIRVGAWPAQFVPVFSPLTQEAVELAEEAELEGTLPSGMALRTGGRASSRGSPMSDVIRDLERAAHWQAGRRQQSWTEKVRQAERVRTDLEAWRRVRERAEPGPQPPSER